MLKMNMIVSQNEIVDRVTIFDFLYAFIGKNQFVRRTVFGNIHFWHTIHHDARVLLFPLRV